MRREELADADCGIAQALGVLGDWWTFLLVRDIAGGTTRFDALQRELGMSRRALTERLAGLVDHGVLEKKAYSAHPPRFDYLLTHRGEALLPTLIALQDWGVRHVMGDGALTATGNDAEVRRVESLIGRRLPDLKIKDQDDRPVRPAEPGGWTVLFFFPGAFAPADTHAYPPGWGAIPGAPGCTLETRTYADRHPAFAAAGVAVRGISTQRPDQLAAYSAWAGLPYPLLSDQDARLAAGLLLPTFRAAGVDRFKRLTLLTDPELTVRAVQFPVSDPAGSVDDMLERASRRTR
ncbi:winged helix-turn-helix transcriptional regulator [Catenuloplanes japonicus]|uniref:winged helix-turn-helix transcriptional regulator n=1 Tax=Catenuloplanes japonicus TaxID=33876 RepID=UPI000524FC0B|nr:winged helix-turn-helix transcriptional regulator [Catenuloplanes japonicus]